MNFPRCIGYSPAQGRKQYSSRPRLLRPHLRYGSHLDCAGSQGDAAGQLVRGHSDLWRRWSCCQAAQQSRFPIIIEKRSTYSRIDEIGKGLISASRKPKHSCAYLYRTWQIRFEHQCVHRRNGSTCNTGSNIQKGLMEESDKPSECPVTRTCLKPEDWSALRTPERIPSDVRANVCWNPSCTSIPPVQQCC